MTRRPLLLLVPVLVVALAVALRASPAAGGGGGDDLGSCVGDPAVRACATAADCTIVYTARDACGAQKALGVATRAAGKVGACTSALDRRVTASSACDPNARDAPPATDEDDAPPSGGRVQPGAIEVACHAGACTSYFEPARVPPIGDGLDATRVQRRALAHWGWVDRDGGVARIPVERAIDLEVARGWR